MTQKRPLKQSNACECKHSQVMRKHYEFARYVDVKKCAKFSKKKSRTLQKSKNVAKVEIFEKVQKYCKTQTKLYKTINSFHYKNFTTILAHSKYLFYFLKLWSFRIKILAHLGIQKNCSFFLHFSTPTEIFLRNFSVIQNIKQF